MIIKYSLRTVNQAVYSRAITALLAAMLAVLIDPIFRFSDYRALLHLLALSLLPAFYILASNRAEMV
jgi:hypothetical protein